MVYNARCIDTGIYGVESRLEAVRSRSRLDTAVTDDGIQTASRVEDPCYRTDRKDLVLHVSSNRVMLEMQIDQRWSCFFPIVIKGRIQIPRSETVRRCVQVVAVGKIYFKFK